MRARKHEPNQCRDPIPLFLNTSLISTHHSFAVVAEPVVLNAKEARIVRMPTRAPNPGWRYAVLAGLEVSCMARSKHR